MVGCRALVMGVRAPQPRHCLLVGARWLALHGNFSASNLKDPPTTSKTVKQVFFNIIPTCIDTADCTRPFKLYGLDRAPRNSPYENTRKSTPQGRAVAVKNTKNTSPEDSSLKRQWNTWVSEFGTANTRAWHLRNLRQKLIKAKEELRLAIGCQKVRSLSFRGLSRAAEERGDADN